MPPFPEACAEPDAESAGSASGDDNARSWWPNFSTSAKESQAGVGARIGAALCRWPGLPQSVSITHKMWRPAATCCQSPGRPTLPTGSQLSSTMSDHSSTSLVRNAPPCKRRGACEPSPINSTACNPEWPKDTRDDRCGMRADAVLRLTPPQR